MDIHRLEVFCKLVELKSFTKAAEAVFLSQPTVSEHIRSLETELQEKLIDRLGREALPTQAGKIVYKYAKKIIQLRNETIQAIENYKGTLAGHLYIGASTIPGTYILPEIIGLFKTQYPAIQVTLKISNSRNAAESVMRGDVEFGIIGAKWNDPGLEWEEIFSDELVLVVHRDHPWAKQKSITLKALEEEPFIIRERDSGTQKVMAEILEKKGLDLSHLNVIAEMGSTEAVRQSVKAQIGVAILSRQAVMEDLSCGSLTEVPIKGVKFNRPFYLIRRKNRNLSPICSVFLDFVQASNGESQKP